MLHTGRLENDLHVCSTVIEGDSTRAWRKDYAKTVVEIGRSILLWFKVTYGVLVLVGVQACVNNTTKQILTQGFN